ncbi:hypothetical protein [Bacillus sp. AK031]
MKKLIGIIAALILPFILITGLIIYLAKEGEFTKWSHTTMAKTYFESGGEYFLSYYFHWDGIANPVLQKIEFIKQDGRVLDSSDSLQITPFISSRGFGTISAEELKAEDLTPVKGYTAEDEFHLALRAKARDSEMEDIRTVRITYKNLGVLQHQDISFEEGIITDEQ